MRYLPALALVLPSGIPTIEIQGFRMVESIEQRRSLELYSNEAKVYRPENLVGLSQPKAFIWGQAERPFEVSGQSAVLDTKSQNFVIRQNAEIISPESYVFRSEELLYESKKRRFVSKMPVRVSPLNNEKNSQRPDISLEGLGFRAYVDQQVYHIEEDVRAKQLMGKKDALEIRSTSSLIDPSANRALFNNSVRVHSQDMTLIGESLESKFSTTQEAYLQSLKLGGSKKKPQISAELQGLSILSDELHLEFEADGELSSTLALGSVEASDDSGMRIFANSLKSQAHEGRERLNMEGGVRILTGDRVARCQTAHYYPDTGEVTLIQVASIRKDNEILEGDVIRFSTKNSEVIVEKARGQFQR